MGDGGTVLLPRRLCIDKGVVSGVRFSVVHLSLLLVMSPLIAPSLEVRIQMPAPHLSNI